MKYISTKKRPRLKKCNNCDLGKMIPENNGFYKCNLCGNIKNGSKKLG